MNLVNKIFQSTLPSQGATSTAGASALMSADFNPRSPHRERPLVLHPFRLPKIFQSTLPSQGATDEKFGEFLNNFISIHAPLTGSDSQREGVKVTVTVFQSTLPSQGATVVDAFMRMAFGDFNPRSPHRERLLAIVKYFRRFDHCEF